MTSREYAAGGIIEQRPGDPLLPPSAFLGCPMISAADVAKHGQRFLEELNAGHPADTPGGHPRA